MCIPVSISTVGISNACACVYEITGEMFDYQEGADTYKFIPVRIDALCNKGWHDRPGLPGRGHRHLERKGLTVIGAFSMVSALDPLAHALATEL